jgi:hypothetical protein
MNAAIPACHAEGMQVLGPSLPLLFNRLNPSRAKLRLVLGFLLAVLIQAGREKRRVGKRYNLIVVPLEDERRYSGSALREPSAGVFRIEK